MTERMNGKTPWEFACEWYGEKEIARAISDQRWNDTMPRDTGSFEFAKWLTNQYRLAMTKGIQIGQQDANQRLRDEVADLKDCREHLRRLGEISGCDHCDSSDERSVQVSHIKRAFDRLATDNDELRQKLTETNGKLAAAEARSESWRNMAAKEVNLRMKIAERLAKAETIIREHLDHSSDGVLLCTYEGPLYCPKC